MDFSLNKYQARSLSDFFFDVAKGVILGGLGLTAVAPFEVKLASMVSSIFLTLLSLKIALTLLEDMV